MKSSKEKLLEAIGSETCFEFIKVGKSSKLNCKLCEGPVKFTKDRESQGVKSHLKNKSHVKRVREGKTINQVSVVNTNGNQIRKNGIK